MEQETFQMDQPMGLVKHPLLMAFGAVAFVTAGWSLAVFALLP